MAIATAIRFYFDLTAIIRIIPMANSIMPNHAKFTPGIIFKVIGTDPPLRPWNIT
jgi:hypothetical protein